jgi:sensor histidine kinase YesM
MSKNEWKICCYSALLISLAVNSAKLMALREDGIIARYWQFDGYEYGFQFAYNFLFCAVLFCLNLADGKFLDGYRQSKRFGRYYLINSIVIILFTVFGFLIQYALFAEDHLQGMVARGYIARFSLSCLLVAIVVRLVLLVREGRKKDNMNALLKVEYLQAQLELLKGQLNPHFLFNSLSSLSGIVRENPKLAQSYIFHLSKVLRNAVTYSGTPLIRVADELDALKSYEQLIVMRLEEAFRLDVCLNPEILHARLPHLSLQPLLENAAKHNAASIQAPLIVKIRHENGLLVVSNNLQPLNTPESATGTGLANLNERFRLLLNQGIDIQKTDDLFIVKLPLVL